MVKRDVANICNFYLICDAVVGEGSFRGSVAGSKRARNTEGWPTYMEPFCKVVLSKY